MQRFSFLPLLGVLFAGCNAPAAQQAATPDATTNTTTDTTTNAAGAPAAATAPAKTYRVVDASQEGNPDPAYQAAMKKVAVAPPSLEAKVPDRARVLMQTSRGPITLELNAKAAPLHVRSFLYLAGIGFYNGVKFHRYADLLGNGKGYIIQGGDPLTKTPATAQFAGQGGPGYSIPREYNDLKHDKLVIAAARSQDPDSAGSQFYITQEPVHFLDEGYTVFGKVVAGADAALKLREGDTINSVQVVK